MRFFIYRVHMWLGLIVALPVLAWATSGLLYAWPEAVEGGKVERIDAARVRLSPEEALRKASEFAGRELPTTALTLLMREGRPVYQAVGGMGADSLLIDAETGAVIKTPPPGLLTRYFRQAHFYFFAGSWQVPLLILFSALAALSALSGLYLNLSWWRRRKLTGMDRMNRIRIKQ
ncbi:MAG TPA: PepSY domain-containing protein [Pyrinomonadaceae bacterium]|nr:PepSY domain-containing protein [Pyrinomonadaceae bacterium]